MVLFSLFPKAIRILSKGNHSERNELIEAEGNYREHSLCDIYLSQAADILDSDCKKGIMICLCASRNFPIDMVIKELN